MPATRMTEADENNLRSLIGRFREQDPVAFIDLLIQSLLIRLDDNSISGFKHYDDSPVPVSDAMLVVFKGYKPAAWAEESIIDLQKRLKTMLPDSDPDED